ncbi:uncharacterized protein [Amphiura filiformis]
MERVREMAAGGDVTPQIPLGRGSSKPANNRQYSNQRQQAPVGDGLLGAAPPGFAPATGSTLGGVANLMQQAATSTLEDANWGNNEQSSQYTSDSRHSRKRHAPSDDNDNDPDKAKLKDLVHRIDWLCKRPNCRLDQPLQILCNAAQKMNNKKIEVECVPVKVPVEEDGEIVEKRESWIVNIYMENMKLITYNSPKGMDQKVAKSNTAEECINNLMNPRSLTINRQKKTSPKGKEFDKEVVVVPLPWLKDETQGYKEKYRQNTDEDDTLSFDPDDPFANFVLIEIQSQKIQEEFRYIQSLQNSSQSNKGSKLEVTVSDTKIPLNGEEVWLCKCVLNGVLIGFATHEDEKMVKHCAAKVAVEFLRKKCPIVKRNHDYEVDQKAAIPLTHIVKDGETEVGLPSSSKVISEENIGHKMLKIMGWTGVGGLGKGGFGISQPIIPIEHIRREGLGFSEKGLNTDAVTKIIEDYISSGNQDPLVFPSSLNRDERKQIHTIAHKFNLRSKSYGIKKIWINTCWYPPRGVYNSW